MPRDPEPFELVRDGLTLRGELARPAAPRGLVVLVHGLGEHAGRYGHVVGRLLDAGWAVGRFDLRGHGRSDGERGVADGLAQLAADVRAVFRELVARAPSGPRFLYGHSMGGTLVAMLALDPPPDLAGAVLSSPGFAPAVPPPRWKVLAARLALLLRPNQRFHGGLPPAGMCRDPQVVRAYESDPLVHGTLSARLGLSLLTRGPELVRRAADARLPLLVLHGEGDRITSFAAARAFARRARATFLPFPGLFHELHNEPEREEVLAAVLRWLAERAAE